MQNPRVVVKITNKIDTYLNCLYFITTENWTCTGFDLYNYAEKIRPNFGTSDEEFIRYKTELFKKFPKLKGTKRYDFDIPTNTVI